jgi:hypothetical protein
LVTGYKIEFFEIATEAKLAERFWVLDGKNKESLPEASLYTR